MLGRTSRVPVMERIGLVSFFPVEVWVEASAGDG